MRGALLLISVGALAAATGCGTQGVQVPDDDPTHAGAQIFAERCSGCHTLDAAGAQGSATLVNDREYKDGPNFNVRKETKDQVLYAIENGGFSSGPMPQDIVTGDDARAVAEFVAKYSGKDATTEVTPGSS